MLTKSQAKERIEKLKREVNYHRYLYHVLDRQEISDSALDSLKNELEKLEEQFPRLRTPDSPTQRVGGMPLKGFRKARHAVPMLSFNDAFLADDLLAWEGRCTKILGSRTSEGSPTSKHGYYAELKIDGLAISLVYRNDILIVGSTRGNGVTGEDVTQNLKTIEAIPLRLQERDDIIKDLLRMGLYDIAARLKKQWPRELEVRGEVFMRRHDFFALNREQKMKGLPPYANPRNVAAGSIRQLDPKVTAQRKLDSYAYDLVTPLGQKTHEQVHKILKALGFKTNPHNHFSKDLDAVRAFHEGWAKNRQTLPYEIDGVVVILDDLASFQRLGVVGKASRGAVAYKFALKESETVVCDIKVQVGRTGALTPVAILKPVEIGGVTVSHATLHNEDEIRRLGIKIGDTVIVGRAGDVIPQVTRVLERLRPRHSKTFQMPKRCPVCKTAVSRDEGGVILKCPNKNCPARHRENLYHFTSKHAFDIVGLGPKIIDKFVDAGLVEDGADFFSLEPGDFADLEGFGEILSQKLVTSIQRRKKISLPRLIYALGILHVGEETAQALARHFKTLENLASASEEELRSIPDVGLKVAFSIVSWFKEKRNQDVLKKLKRAGVHAERILRPAKPQILQGKTIVFTGSLETMTRDEAKNIAREYGADVSESVSKKTDFIVIGEEPGSKYEQAKKLGVRILTEKEFLAMLPQRS